MNTANETLPKNLAEIRHAAARTFASSDAIVSVEIRTAWPALPAVWVDRDMNVTDHNPHA